MESYKIFAQTLISLSLEKCLCMSLYKNWPFLNKGYTLGHANYDHFFQTIFKIITQGANDTLFYTEFRTVFLFSVCILVFLSFRFEILKNQRGDPWVKKMKKLDFHVWYIKRTALKNLDWEWNRFSKILVFVEVIG